MRIQTCFICLLAVNVVRRIRCLVSLTCPVEPGWLCKGVQMLLRNTYYSFDTRSNLMLVNMDVGTDTSLPVLNNVFWSRSLAGAPCKCCWGVATLMLSSQASCIRSTNTLDKNINKYKNKTNMEDGNTWKQCLFAFMLGQTLETNHGNQVLPGGLTGVTAAELLPEEGKVTCVWVVRKSPFTGLLPVLYTNLSLSPLSNLYQRLTACWQLIRKKKPTCDQSTQCKPGDLLSNCELKSEPDVALQIRNHPN